MQDAMSEGIAVFCAVRVGKWYNRDAYDAELPPLR